MFDPHATRRNDRRYFTKRGQIIQARSVSVPFGIERSKVDAYKEYILKNNLFTPPPPGIINLTKISFSASTLLQPIPFESFVYTRVGRPVELPSPSCILFYITNEDQYYNLNVWVTDSPTFEPGTRCWYYAIAFQPTIVFKLFFQSDSITHFALDLYDFMPGSGDRDLNNNIDIYKSSYHIPLSAPSG